MGWTSTGDPYANVGDAGLVFESREAAIAFATKHGWQYSVSSTLSLHLQPYIYLVNPALLLIRSHENQVVHTLRIE